MTQCQHLPLYVKTYEFIKLIYRTVQQFRKEYKFSLGEDLIGLIWNVFDEIVATNCLPNHQKSVAIGRISSLFEKFKVRWRLAYEIGLITDSKFCTTRKEIEEIGKMIGGWQSWADNEKLDC